MNSLYKHVKIFVVGLGILFVGLAIVVFFGVCLAVIALYPITGLLTLIGVLAYLFGSFYLDEL